MRYVSYVVITGCELKHPRTIILGGHETTANTLSWILLELARNPHVQKKLRNEIRSMEQTIQSRANREFTPADLDSMTYLNAFVKVTIALEFNVAITYRITGVTSILSRCCYYLPPSHEGWRFTALKTSRHDEWWNSHCTSYSQRTSYHSIDRCL